MGSETTSGAPTAADSLDPSAVCTTQDAAAAASQRQPKRSRASALMPCDAQATRQISHFTTTTTRLRTRTFAASSAGRWRSVRSRMASAKTAVAPSPMNNTVSQHTQHRQHTQHTHHHERRALGEYAEQNGKDGAGLVNGFFKGLEAFDLRLFEAGRFSRPIADGTDEVLDGAIAALDRSVFTVVLHDFSVTSILALSWTVPMECPTAPLRPWTCP